MKKCGACNEIKETFDFHKNPSKKDGLQTMCKSCRKKYHKIHYEKNKYKYLENSRKNRTKLKNLINRYKQIKGCASCKDSRFYVLDFHHNEDKDSSISEMLSQKGFSKNKIKKEISKCIILCANCHRELHYKEKLASNA